MTKFVDPAFGTGKVQFVSGKKWKIILCNFVNLCSILATIMFEYKTFSNTSFKIKKNKLKLTKKDGFV